LLHDNLLFAGLDGGKGKRFPAEGELPGYSSGISGKMRFSGRSLRSEVVFGDRGDHPQAENRADQLRGRPEPERQDRGERHDGKNGQDETAIHQQPHGDVSGHRRAIAGRASVLRRRLVRQHRQIIFPFYKSQVSADEIELADMIERALAAPTDRDCRACTPGGTGPPAL
jgi:hypothetical protein